MAGVVSVPWYATVFRGDQLEKALAEIAPVALRYGASEFMVLRAGDDRYRFQQLSWFEDKLDFDRYWLGEEFVAWRADFSSFFQVPLVYSFQKTFARGEVAEAAEAHQAQVS